jgi:D-3-phosphoglycerate dehydrogenase
MATEQTPAPIDRKRLRSQRLVITPHAAYYSEESIETVRRFAAEEVVRVLTGQPTLSPVNADQLAEPRWSRSP